MSNIQKNIDLNKQSVKHKILQYLDGKVKQSNIPSHINDVNDINAIKKNNYIICPKSSGIKSWIMFIKLNENYYYAISFPKNGNNNIDSLNIYPININANPNLYNGTIMEGTYNMVGNVKQITIDDIYYYCGIRQTTKSKSDRLDYLTNNLYDSFREHPTFRIRVSPYYNINKLELEDLYKKIKDDDSIREIIFYPQIYGGQIYVYVITGEDLIDKVIKTSIFYMKKTQKSDIYNLIDIDSNEKLDIATIPDMKTSKMCKRWFIDNKTDTLKVRCQYDFYKHKWQPIETI